MAGQNFTIVDLEGAWLACLLFASLGLAPGYVLGWLGDIYSFRQRRFRTRLVLATALSVSVSPILCYWVGWLLTMKGLLAACALVSLAAAGLIARDWRAMAAKGDRLPRAGLAMAALWIVVAILSLVDLQMQDRLYFSPVAHDYAIRAAITDAISRTGVRPYSPFFYPGAPVPLRYHHFWFILSSVVEQMGGKAVDPRHGLIAGTVWAGLGMIAVVPLYLRFFYDSGKSAIDRRSLVGIGLLAVTGLDLLPTLVLMRFSHAVQADIDFWNTPIFFWVGSTLWASHHVAALISCLTGFLLLWPWWAGSEFRPGPMLVAGPCFATAAGCSVYVTLVFVAFIGFWAVILMARRSYRQIVPLLAAGLLAGALAAPHLWSLVSHGPAGGGESAALIKPWIRTFRIAEILMGNDQSLWWRPLVHALLLPLNYFLEFGFFFVIGVLGYKRLKSSRKLTLQQLALAAMLLTSLLMATFLRSSVIAFNDLGMRGIMLAQFVLLLWAVELWPGWESMSRNVRLTLTTMLLLGVAGTAYGVAILRVFPILADRGIVEMPTWLSPDRNLGARTMAMRQAYAVLASKLPANAIVQNNPDVVVDDYYFGLYADRQTASAARGCYVAFGGSPKACNSVMQRLTPLFDPGAEFSKREPIGVDALILKDTDPAWKNPGSWIWHARPFYANEMVRIFEVPQIP